MLQGLSGNKNWVTDIGCAAFGFDCTGSMALAAWFFWPKDFTTGKRDKNETGYGDKTATLEMIGTMLPLLLAPELVAGRHVVSKFDIVACVFDIENGQLKNDESSYILIRTAKLIAAYVGMVLHVEHVSRRSCWEVELANNLSRRSTTSFLVQRALNRFGGKRLPDVLLSWFNNPVCSS
jgi:hypothetical protein